MKTIKILLTFFLVPMLSSSCSYFYGFHQGFTENGEWYLNGLSRDRLPPREKIKIGNDRNHIHLLQFSDGECIGFARATDKEIILARAKNPKKAMGIDAKINGFLAGEYAIQPFAKKNAMKKEQFWETFFEPAPSLPLIPSKFQKYKNRWRWGWERGWSYNFDRYYQWYRRYGPNVDSCSEIPVKKTWKPESGLIITKDSYDSGWLLYDPGEFKILPHHLNVPPGKIGVKMILKIKGNRTVESFGDLTHEKGAVWSDLNSSTIRVHRLYKDDQIEAIRVQMWVKK
jgi:hypothetical protein